MNTLENPTLYRNGYVYSTCCNKLSSLAAGLSCFSCFVVCRDQVVYSAFTFAGSLWNVNALNNHVQSIH